MAGVSIELFGSCTSGRNPAARSTTGKTGEFAFPVSPGLYDLKITPDRSTRFVGQYILDIQVFGNTVQNIILSPGNMVAGIVCSASGQALAGCSVHATKADSSSLPIEVETDQYGAFEFLLARGDYSLFVKDGAASSTGKQCVISPFLATTGKRLRVEDDLSFDVIMPQLNKVDLHVKAAGGKPAGAATITIRPLAHGNQPDDLDYPLLWAVGTTDKDGNLSFQIEAGVYDLNIRPDETEPCGALTDRGRRISGSQSIEYRLPEGRRLKGRITFQGRAVANCTVRAIGGGDGQVLEDVSDGEGRFSLAVSRGQYTLTFLPIGMAPPSPAPCRRCVRVAGDTEILVELKTASSITGSVVSGEAEPRPHVSVSVFCDEGSRPASCSPEAALVSTRTAADGNFFFGLERGSYWVCINSQPSTFERFPLVEDCQELNLVWASGHIVTFDVRTLSDAPVANCRVAWDLYFPESRIQSGAPQSQPEDGLTSGACSSSAVGLCQVNIPAGIYAFTFQPPAGSGLEATSIRQLSVASDLKRKVILSRSRHPDASVPG